MKGLKIFLKFLVLALTAIWGVVFGIVSPLVLMNSGAEYSDNPIFILWLVMAGAGYIIPCFLVMLRVFRVAAAFSTAGTVMVFIMYNMFAGLGVEPTPLYMPQIFMTILTVIIAVAENFKKIVERGEERRQRDSAIAPSVLGKSSDGGKKL